MNNYNSQHTGLEIDNAISLVSNLIGKIVIKRPSEFISINTVNDYNNHVEDGDIVEILVDTLDLDNNQFLLKSCYYKANPNFYFEADNINPPVIDNNQIKKVFWQGGLEVNNIGGSVKFDLNSQTEIITYPLIGTIRNGAFENIPNGWLACDGSEVNIDDYPLLFRVIGNNFYPPPYYIDEEIIIPTGTPGMFKLPIMNVASKIVSLNPIIEKTVMQSIIKY